jgi:apolipoprotein N-acyltransferase
VRAVPVLWLALRSGRRDAAWMTLLAATLGLSSNVVYFRLLMPLPAVLAAIAVKALLWLLVVLATRRLVLRYRAGWTVLAYPVLWVAIDTLMAALLPDGNWGSLAYSQADNLAVLQVTALVGVPGLLFLLCLAPSALALLLAGGRAYVPAALATGLLLLAAFAGGGWRAHAAPAPAGRWRDWWPSMTSSVRPRRRPARKPSGTSTPATSKRWRGRARGCCCCRKR